jgi:hypothetical protein
MSESSNSTTICSSSSLSTTPTTIVTSRVAESFTNYLKLTNEWESTISIPISESDYIEANRTGQYEIDVIFLDDSGLRLSGRCVQRKVTTFTRHLINFHKGRWFPIKRTISEEEMVNVTQMLKVKKCIHRLQRTTPNGIRITYNKEETNDGCRYNVKYEIEYPENSMYDVILENEQKLVEQVMKDGYKIARSKMDLTNIFSCVMTKVQMWHCFDVKKDYLWAYKWNGIKAKLLIADKTNVNGTSSDGECSNVKEAFMWPDAKDIVVDQCYGENYEPVLNFCFLVEIMEDFIVIIEAIGALIDGIIYTTEPKTNTAVLAYLNEHVPNLRIGNKQVRIQKFFPPPLPNTYDSSNFDGFIIVQDDMIIKWKIPTIDVKCIEPYKYKVASKIIQLSFAGDVGDIYELSHKYEIIRKRNDRIAPSNEQEYNMFLKSIEHLNEEDSQPTIV